MNPNQTPQAIIPATARPGRPLVSKGGGSGVKWGDWPGTSGASTGPVNATQIQGVNVSSTAPSSNQVLEYVSGAWTPTTLSSSTPTGWSTYGSEGGSGISATYPSSTTLSNGVAVSGYTHYIATATVTMKNSNTSGTGPYDAYVGIGHNSGTPDGWQHINGQGLGSTVSVTVSVALTAGSTGIVNISPLAAVGTGTWTAQWSSISVVGIS